MKIVFPPDPNRVQVLLRVASKTLRGLLTLPLLASALLSQTTAPLPEVTGLDIVTIESLHDQKMGAAAVGDGSLWFISEGHLFNVDPNSDQLNSLALEDARGYGFGAAEFGGGSIWTLGSSHNLPAIYRLDTVTGKRLAVIELPALKDRGEKSMAYGEGALWVLNQNDGTLLRIDAGSNQLSPPLQVGKGDWAAVQVGEGAVWIIGLENGTIKRIDPRSNQVVDEFSGGPKQHNGIFSSPFKFGVYALCVGAGGLWVIDNKVLSSGEYTLSRIDPKTHDHVATIKVANGVGAPVFWKGFAWVPTLGYHLTGHSITKVDPATNKVVGEVSLSVVRGRTVLSDQGSRPPTLHADEDSLWAFSGGSLVRRIRLKN